jgi:hypothetical protein
MNAYNFTCTDDSLEIMLQHPSGKVEFMSIWKSLWFAATLIRQGCVVHLNGEKI